MGAILALLVAAFAAMGLVFLGCWLIESIGDFAVIPGIASLVTGVIGIFVSIFLAINAMAWGVTAVNIDAHVARNQERSIMYADMITAYEDLRDNDVTASESYINLYKEVIDFNHEIDKADRHHGEWWAEGLLYDPSYVGVNSVPLRVME